MSQRGDFFFVQHRTVVSLKKIFIVECLNVVSLKKDGWDEYCSFTFDVQISIFEFLT